MYHINMHVHSIYSDGTQSPEEIIRVAYYCGMKAVVLTEHDVVSSITRVCREAQIYGLDTITGVEFSGEFKAHTPHILAFGFDPANSALLSHIDMVTAVRNDHTQRVFTAAVRQGKLRYGWERVLEQNPGQSWFCNNQVFNAMYADGLVGVHDYDAFLENYMSGNDAAGRLESPDLADVIRVISEAGGVPVLAHPKHTADAGIDDTYILELAEMGIRGVEAVYPTHSAADAARLMRLAEKHGLYMTGGTDLHGLYDEHFVSFQSHGTTKEEYMAIKERVYG